MQRQLHRISAQADRFLAQTMYVHQALFEKELVSVHSITLPETCDIWGKHHHSGGQPFI
jgi:hypothetical protein